MAGSVCARALSGRDKITPLHSVLIARAPNRAPDNASRSFLFKAGTAARFFSPSISLPRVTRRRGISVSLNLICREWEGCYFDAPFKRFRCCRRARMRLVSPVSPPLPPSPSTSLKDRSGGGRSLSPFPLSAFLLSLARRRIESLFDELITANRRFRLADRSTAGRGMLLINPPRRITHRSCCDEWMNHLQKRRASF